MIHIFIKSFNRPDMLGRLLSDLQREAETGQELLAVEVWDDASTADMSACRSLCDRVGWRWHQATSNFGKRKAWEWHNQMYHRCRQVQGDHPGTGAFMFFDDDMRLCERFLDRAFAAWESLAESTRGTLHFLVDDSRQDTACWTDHKPVKISALARWTQWVDGSFMCDRRALEAIDYRLQPISPARWRKEPGRSTGVGEQLSLRLTEKGLRLYQSAHSLVAHVGARDSRYNPGERVARPLRTVRFIDGPAAVRRLTYTLPVFCSIATQAVRVPSLERVVEALAPQVDKLRIYLNDHTDVPAFLHRDNIDFALVTGDDELANKGDAGKFHWAADPTPAFCLTCDDDIAYPADYALKMVDAIEGYQLRCAVGVHGVRLRSDITSYYRDRLVQHFAGALPKDAHQHILGTGTLGYFSGALALTADDFPEPNMADIWFGLAAQKQRVPLIAISRRDKWLTPLPTLSSIHERAVRSDHRQTELVKSIRWRIATNRPRPGKPPEPPTRAPITPEERERRNERVRRIYRKGRP